MNNGLKNKIEATGRKIEDAIYWDGKIAVFREVAKRNCHCPKCEVDAKIKNILVGEERLTSCLERQPKGVHSHIACFGKNGKHEDIEGHDSEYDALSRMNHLLEIHASRYCYEYYCSLGFTYRTKGSVFFKDLKNGYSAQVVRVALETGDTVRVNGVKITTVEEYQKLTLK